jgi:hypothetical protein
MMLLIIGMDNCDKYCYGCMRALIRSQSSVSLQIQTVYCLKRHFVLSPQFCAINNLKVAIISKRGSSDRMTLVTRDKGKLSPLRRN